MSEPGIGGIYETCIGVRDTLPLVHYFEQFGYRIGRLGTLGREECGALYGVDSELRSTRLLHQDADHGLIRLMEWTEPTGDGLGIAPMRVKGNRWITSQTADLLQIMNHIEEARAAGMELSTSHPHWDCIYQRDDARGRPFLDPAVGVREVTLLQPLTRQIFYQRFGYDVPGYGSVNESSRFRTSQGCHMGIVLEDGTKDAIDFYVGTLGLLLARDDIEYSYDGPASGREIFDLRPGERYWVTSLDDPRSSTDWRLARSGRLYMIRFAPGAELEDYRERSRPGCLGLSMYTYRVGDIGDYEKRVAGSAASGQTDTFDNEFGEKSFAFIAPDGYSWNLLEGG